jgi:hypothetical protein
VEDEGGRDLDVGRVVGVRRSGKETGVVLWGPREGIGINRAGRHDQGRGGGEGRQASGAWEYVRIGGRQAQESVVPVVQEVVGRRRGGNDVFQGGFREEGMASACITDGAGSHSEDERILHFPRVMLILAILHLITLDAETKHGF